MAKAIVIHADGKSEVKELPDYDSIKAELGGGWLEAVTLGEGAMAYVDEEGKLKDLPYNDKATQFCHENRFIFSDDFIVGTFIIFGTLNEVGVHDCNEHDVPKNLIEKIING